MRETYWWSDIGPFRPWKSCPTRPDPGAVLQFYLEKRGIEPEEQVAYLIVIIPTVLQIRETIVLQGVVVV